MKIKTNRWDRRERQRAPRLHSGIQTERRPETVELPTREDSPLAVVVPTVSHLVSDGLAILKREMTKLDQASRNPEELSQSQSKNLARFVRAIVQLASEEREQRLEADGLTDDQIISELLSDPGMREILSAHIRALAQQDDGGSE